MSEERNKGSGGVAGGGKKADVVSGDEYPVAANAFPRPGRSPMEDCMSKSLEQLTDAFKSSAKRWELIVYPSLLAFIVLAAYGFFLIYSLTKDVNVVARQMESIRLDMKFVSESMADVSKNMASVSRNLADVSVNMQNVSRDVRSQSVVMQEMVVHMRDMNRSMQTMTATVDQMRYHFAVMNNSISRPMSFMNSFMPW